MHISLFVSSESVLLEVATSTTFEEYDSENSLHYCEDDGRTTMTVSRPCVGGPRAPPPLSMHVVACGWSSMAV